MIEVEPDRTGWVSVTFRVPAEAAADEVAVVGDFNEWNRHQHLLRPRGDGSHALTLRLTTGRRYRFRYLLDDDRWQNDWQADDYVPNEYGGDDSVLDLTPNGPRRDDLIPE
jgi:1,4-alpha-glucan branching enzyme